MILIFPGSFDPVTNGHIDIALRCAKFADKIIFAIFEHPVKKSIFSVKERLRLIEDALRETDLGDTIVEFDSFEGLLAEYVKQSNATAILRGLRSPADFQAELPYSIHNKALSGGVDTIYLASNPDLSHISSSIVKEIASHAFATKFGEEALKELVPQNVFEALRRRYSKLNS